MNIDVAYVRGSQIRFIVLPSMLSKAPFFNRIKMWRKFKGHAVFGLGGLIGPRGQTAAIMQKSQLNRRPGPGGPGQPGPGPGQGMPPRGFPPPFNNNAPPYQQQQGPPQHYGGGGYNR